jgi:hypothetical protein
MRNITDSVAGKSAPNMTVTLTFGVTTLTETTNIDGLVTFRAYNTMDFIAGSLVTIVAIDVSNEFYSRSVVDHVLAAGATETVPIDTALFNRVVFKL